MKKILCLITMLFSLFSVKAQDAKEEGVDLLKAPASPASQLLNIAPNSVERPTDLSSFWLSINSNTGNLSKIPTNYAFDISPTALFGRPISLKDLNATSTKEIIRQSFIISAGIRTDEDTLTSNTLYRAALGFKVSFARPQWTTATNRNYKILIRIQERITDKMEEIGIAIEELEPLQSKNIQREKILREKGRDSEEFLAVDQEYNELRKLVLETAIANDPELNALLTNVRLKARDFKIERKGWFLDFAGGMSFSFPTSSLGYSLADRSGAWLTGGYEGGDKNISVLGIARYLYQPEMLFVDPSGVIPTKNISTFDAGTRFIYTSVNGLFDISFESIYRSVLNKNIIGSSWRLIFSAGYDIGFNKKLTINFGRDFDGTTQKGGTLLAGINFITGFGNKRLLK
jgi:hypothetical protein